MSQNLRRTLIVAAAVIAGVFVAALMTSIFGPEPEFEIDESPPESAAPQIYDDIIHAPAGLGTLRTELRDIHGDPIGVACSTCHLSGNLGDPPAKSADELSEFHVDMDFDHGDLACSSCHAEDNRNQLKLADGTQIDYDDSMELCAQCHSSTYRSYKHGAHGGMAGHWDDSAGPRERNHCLSCHYAHEPAFPDVMPAPPPRDRYFEVPTDQ